MKFLVKAKLLKDKVGQWLPEAGVLEQELPAKKNKKIFWSNRSFLNTDCGDGYITE